MLEKLKQKNERILIYYLFKMYNVHSNINTYITLCALYYDIADTMAIMTRGRLDDELMSRCSHSVYIET